MGDRLKTAYELALERLKKKEAAGGTAGAPERLSQEQKERIADIRQEYRAKLAEKEILFSAQRREARGDLEALARLEDSHRRDRELLESRREARIQEVRSGGKS